MVKFDATAEVEFHADKSACGSSDEIDVEESKKCMWSREKHPNSWSLEVLGIDDIKVSDQQELLSPNLSGTDVEDRKIRRQIANCNERRRMQSINAGFSSLRQLLPKKDGDKISKAAILQHTADLIVKLLEEKDRLTEENCVKKRKLDEYSDNRASQQWQMERLEYLKVIEELRTMLANETQLRISCENELKAIKTKLDLITAAAAARQDLTNGANQLLTTLMATAEKTRLNNLGQMSPTANDYLMSIDTLACKMPFLYSNAPLISALQVPSLETQIPPFNNNMLISPPDSHQSTTFNPNGLDARTLNDDGSLLQPNWCANPLTLEQKEAATASSVSQRNLQAMLEAIRHLEGDA